MDSSRNRTIVDLLMDSLHISEPGVLDPESTDPILRAEQDQIVGLLTSRMHTEEFEANEYLMRQGDTGQSLMLITKGMAEISSTDDDGARHLIGISGVGSLVGEMSLLTEEPRSADVIATESVSASVLPAETFHELVKIHPAISMVLTKLVSTRLGRKKHDALAGKTLDVFRINNRIAHGGMAVVYHAEELSTGCQVALKMMSHRLVYDTTAFALFQREADIIESFEHNSVVRVLGRFAAFRTYFIVMELCEGPSLEEVLRLNGPIVESEARRIIGQVAGALCYAHSHDVVHRDVKLSNLILSTGGVVKLTDFGLAKPVVDTSLDKIDPIVGTPRNMAPEQWRGEGVGTRTDYFGFGCTIYRMLTDKWLISESEINRLMNDNGHYETPDISSLCVGISSELCDLIQTCVQVDPDQRNIDLGQVSQWAEPVSSSLANGFLCETD